MPHEPKGTLLLETSLFRNLEDRIGGLKQALADLIEAMETGRQILPRLDAAKAELREP
jgi:hypothetical protein